LLYNTAPGIALFEFSNRKVFEVGLYLPFPRTNYDTKNNLVLDLTDKRLYLYLRLEAIHFHLSSKKTALPRFLKANVVNIYPGLHVKINNLIS
jgi:hypothetical protein